MNRTKIVAFMISFSLLASVGTFVIQVEAVTLSFITIDLSDVDPTLTDTSKSKNADDFPFGIECGDPEFVYVTVFKQGLLVKINKNTRAVEQLIDQPDEQVTVGQNLYSITRDPNTGNLFMIESSNGELWKFEPSSLVWTRVPLVEQIVHPAVSYPLGFTINPTFVRVDESEAPEIPPFHSPHDYSLSTSPLTEIIFANGNVWAALSYQFDFDEFAEAVGVSDVLFAGIVKVDPTTLQVERVPILDAEAPTGLTIDASDPSIIWITDILADKIYRFDTVTQTVTHTVSDPLIDEPRGIATDDTNVFVALNKFGDLDFDEIPDGNSTIAQISKSTLQVSIIDTGAPVPNDDDGTFSVFVNNGLLVWTDESSHVGIIDLITGEKSFETTTDTESNHFGCIPFDGEFWFAGRGSAKVGILPNSKFSGGRPVRATGGGGGGLYRGRDFAFGNPDDPRYDSNAPVIEEVLVQEGSLKIVVKITDTVGVEGAQTIVGKKVFSMSRHDGSLSWWYRVFTADDLPDAGDTLLVKIVAWDYNKNKVEHSVTVDVPFGALSSSGASFAIRPLSAYDQTQSTYAITASGIRPNDQTINPQITIKNTSTEPIRNIRLILSPELKGKFLLSDYAIKSIPAESEYTVSLKLNGKSNVDAMNNPIPYSGHVIISVDNKTPYILEIAGNVPNESASLQSLFMKMIADKSEQRYKNFEKPDLRISQDEKYQVTLGSGADEIKSVLDELIITNNGDKPLRNLRIMTSALSDHFLPDQKNIELLPPGSFVKVKLVPKTDDALVSRDINGELLVVPENGNPVMVPINIGKKLADDRNSMYVVTTLSGNDAVSNTADGIVIRNNSQEPIDNVRVILSQQLARVFSVSEDSFKSVEPNSEITVHLQQRGTADSNVRQILNDYRGEIIIVSSDGMKKTIPVDIVWKGISSEHFVVYARDDAQELARATQTINFLERSYPKFTEIVDEVETKTVIYMTSSLEEIKMLSDALAPSTYVYDEDIGFVWSNSEDLNMLALKEFAYRTIMQNYGTYWAKQKITLDKGNWLVDGIANYATASIVGERRMIKEQLDAFIAEPTSFEWYGVSALSQHGASYTLFKYLADRYGDTIIDKILNNLGSTMVSNNRCETMEQCSLLKAVYDANGWNMNDKRRDLSFVTIAKEWKSYVEEEYTNIP